MSLIRVERVPTHPVGCEKKWPFTAWFWMNQHKGGCELCVACRFKFIYKNRERNRTATTAMTTTAKHHPLAYIRYTVDITHIKTRKMYAPIYSAYKIDITITKRPLCSQWKGTKQEWKKNKRRTHNGNYCKVRTSNSVKTWAKVVGIGGHHHHRCYRNNIKINFVFLSFIIVVIVYCSFITHLSITPLPSIHSLFQCCHVK